MNDKRLNYKLINLTMLMLLLYITISNIGTWYNILCEVVHIIFPFLIAFTIAYALTPIIAWAEKRKIRKSISVFLLVFIVVGFIVFILMNIMPLIYEQLMLLSGSLGDIVGFVSEKLDVNIGSFEIKIDEYLNDIISNIGMIVSSGTIDIVLKSFSVISNIVVTFIATIYFLIYMDRFKQSIKLFFSKFSKKVFLYVSCLDKEIGNYIKGLSLFMFIQFVEYSLLYRLVNHPNWLILGFLACLTTVIPYFGGLITNIIAIILAIVLEPSILIGTIVICLIFPQIDGYFISPKIYGRTNNINPLITIIIVSIGGTLAGVVGIIASLPVYLLIRCTFRFCKNDLMTKFLSLKEVI